MDADKENYSQINNEMLDIHSVDRVGWLVFAVTAHRSCKNAKADQE